MRVRDLSVCAWWSATASHGSGVSERFGGVERRKKDRAVPTHCEATQLFRRDAEFKDRSTNTCQSTTNTANVVLLLFVASGF